MEEENSTDSVITAATNHPQLLDEALFRRFDDIIQYDLPDATMIEQVLRDRLTSFDTGSVEWEAVREAGLSLSQAEIVRAADEVGQGSNHSTRKKVNLCGSHHGAQAQKGVVGIDVIWVVPLWRSSF